MQFDNLDKKVKEAAEQHHPAYDENAWRKMESLLNEHLPQEKNRRRFFLLAFAILLIGGGSFYLLSKPHAENPGQVVQELKNSTNNETKADPINKNNTAVQPNAEHPSGNIINDKTITTGAPTKITGESSKRSLVINQRVTAPGTSKSRINKNELSTGNVIDDQDKNVAGSEPERRSDIAGNAPVSLQPNDRIVKNENSVNSPVTKENNIASNTQPVQGSPTLKTSQKNGRPDRMNGFSFFVSAGPDVSKAQNSKAGKVTMSWGVGVAYTLNRLTLKTGVFSTNKIYRAGPDDYKLAYTPPPTLKFMGADANCRVIEIPVKLSYNFATRNRSNWFAGAGLSSYLMKREDYLYEYESNTGTYYHAYETKNENKHYFSVLNLSGGYSYQLSNTISLSAEPYLEVPLTGIGVGKVHLNSGGVLFTIGVSPFRK